jgi:hypothetical protein
MLGLACRPSSPGHCGPFEAVTKSGAGIPVAGVMSAAAASACVSLLIGSYSSLKERAGVKRGFGPQFGLRRGLCRA